MKQKNNVRVINTSLGSFFIDLRDDFYGDDHWNKLEKEYYEPDTLSFIRRHVDGESNFIDLGASNGDFTLLASLRGAKVYSIEPHRLMFKVLTRNIRSNLKLKSRINCYNIAISNENIVIDNSKVLKHSSILTPITFNKIEDFPDKFEVVSLDKFLSKIKNGRKFVIKMDIEGAEWKILADKKQLEALQAHQAIVLLAIHPGFVNPPKLSNNNLRLTIKLKFWFKIFIQSYNLYKLLEKKCLISRTNDVSVTNKYKFICLIFGGYYEFILDFRER